MIISVASGKGGTGKTLVATSLALSLKDRERVQLLDCDVEEPNDHIFLSRLLPAAKRSVSLSLKLMREKCTYCGKCAEVCAYHAIAVFAQHVLVFPNLCHGCGACSYLCPEKAITEEDREIGVVECGHSDGIEFAHGKLNVGEAMATPVIRKVKEKANRDGIVIIDVSPGTSCPVVESIKGSDFCLLVTEPTPFGLNDLALAVETVRKLEVPCGVVINRAGIGDSGVEEYCRKRGYTSSSYYSSGYRYCPVNYSRGITLVEGMPQWKESFIRLFEHIQEIVSERSRSLKR